MADAAVTTKPKSDFVAQLEAANLHPLWDRFRTLTPVKPQAKDPPLLWRWKDIEPFTERAVSEVAIDDVERRALILVNSAFGGETVTTLAEGVGDVGAIVEQPATSSVTPKSPKSIRLNVSSQRWFAVCV